MANYQGMFLSTSAGRILSPGTTTSGGGTVSNSLAVTAPPVAELGDAVLVIGAVSPAGHTVQIALSASGTTAPTEGWAQAVTNGSLFAGLITPEADGTYYAWASDLSTSITAASGSIVVSGTITIPDGVTPNLLSAAGAVSDTDTALVAQGGANVLAQPFSAIWTWMQGKLPGYIMPQVTISESVALDNSAHNGRLLVVDAAGVTISASGSMGAGFSCKVLNDSGGTITLSGITRSAGGSTVPAGAQGEIVAYTLSGTLALNTDL